MLKKNWRNNKLFWHIFVIGEILNWRGEFPGLPPLPLGYAYAPIEEKKCLQIFRNVSGVF